MRSDYHPDDRGQRPRDPRDSSERIPLNPETSGRYPDARVREGRNPNGNYPKGRNPNARYSDARGSNGRYPDGRGTNSRPPASRGSNGGYPDGRGRPPGGGGKGRKRKKKSALPLVIVLIVAILLISAASVVIYFSSFNNSLEPVDIADNEKIAFEVKEGSTTAIIADNLEAHGLIRNASFFISRTKKNGYDGKFKPGLFSLSKSMSTDEIIEALSFEGAYVSDVTTFTIPEGLTLEQTMNILVEKELLTEEEFKNEVANGVFEYQFMEGLPEGENRLEGFLYPNTYEVFKGATPHEILDTMLAHFDTEFTEEDYDAAKKLKMSVLEVVAMASLIERETMIDEERSRVAGVIYNRLELDMMLQIDAAIQYILPEVKESLLYSDLEIDSPYNLYQNYGLPPGPICSPRIASIQAALHPEEHDFVYYVLSELLDGTHNFSESAEEFEINKERYYEALENS